MCPVSDVILNTDTREIIHWVVGLAKQNCTSNFLLCVRYKTPHDNSDYSNQYLENITIGDDMYLKKLSKKSKTAQHLFHLNLVSELQSDQIEPKSVEVES